MCNNEENIIEQIDFECVGDVAKHCDLKKLCIAISEAQDFDMDNLFCDFWQDILSYNTIVDNYDIAYEDYLIALAECEADPECTTPPTEPTKPENYDIYKNLICGGSFIGCGDKQRTHAGIKKILVYYAYSRYLILNQQSDTPYGTVRKTNEFSMPTPLKEVQSFADKYRTMAYESYKKTMSFLCKNTDIFVDWNNKECGKCGCGGNCESGTKAKGYGFRSSTISKNI